MGLLDLFFPKVSQQHERLASANSYFKTLTAYQPIFTSWSGEIYESELVRSSIDARARHIGKLRIEIKGASKPKLTTQIKKRPNPYQTWFQFLYRLSTILDVNNTAFVFPVFDKYMELCGYYTALPTRWALVKDEHDNPWIKVEFSDRQPAVYKLSEVGILTKFQYHSDFFGDSNRALDETMALIDIQNQGIKEAVKSSATFRFMAQVNNFSKAEDLSKERERFNRENFVNKSGGGLLLFPNTYTNIEQIKATPYVTDKEQRELIDQNVFNYFGVNIDVLQNKAIGDAWSAFYEGAVEPFAIQLSEVLTKMTYTEIEQGYGAQLIATANRLQYMSNKDKLEVSSQMADRGLMTINEIRDIWNLPALPNGDVAVRRGEYYTDGEREEETDE